MFGCLCVILSRIESVGTGDSEHVDGYKVLSLLCIGVWSLFVQVLLLCFRARCARAERGICSSSRGAHVFCLFPSGQDTKFHPHDDDADGDGDGEGGLRLSLSLGLSLSS